MSGPAPGAPNGIGEWAAPNGERVVILALPSNTNITVTATVLIDGQILEASFALALLYAQREYFKTKLADARARLTQAGLEAP